MLKLKLVHRCNIEKKIILFDTILLNENEIVLWGFDGEEKTKANHPVIYYIVDGIVKQSIDVRRFLEVKHYSGREFAMFTRDNYVWLINFKEAHRWNLECAEYTCINIQNPPEIFPDNPRLRLRLAGKSNSDTIPFLVETNVIGETPYFILLKYGKNELQWVVNTIKCLNIHDYPMKVQHIANPDIYTYNDLSDIAWRNGNLLIYTTGFHKAYGKYPMDYSIHSHIDRDGRLVEKLFQTENCFGRFSSDLKYIVMKPLYKKSATKGKQFLVNLQNMEVEEVKLPKGFTNYFIHDNKEDLCLLSNTNGTVIRGNGMLEMVTMKAQ